MAKQKGESGIEIHHFQWFISSQSHLSSFGGSQIEHDYRLVDNESLFQEYLEMGKVLTELIQFNTIASKCFNLDS